MSAKRRNQSAAEALLMPTKSKTISNVLQQTPIEIVTEIMNADPTITVVQSSDQVSIGADNQNLFLASLLANPEKCDTTTIHTIEAGSLIPKKNARGSQRKEMIIDTNQILSTNSTIEKSTQGPIHTPDAHNVQTDAIDQIKMVNTAQSMSQDLQVKQLLMLPSPQNLALPPTQNQLMLPSIQTNVLSSTNDDTKSFATQNSLPSIPNHNNSTQLFATPTVYNLGQVNQQQKQQQQQEQVLEQQFVSPRTYAKNLQNEQMNTNMSSYVPQKNIFSQMYNQYVSTAPTQPQISNTTNINQSLHCSSVIPNYSSPVCTSYIPPWAKGKSLFSQALRQAMCAPNVIEQIPTVAVEAAQVPVYQPNLSLQMNQQQQQQIETIVPSQQQQQQQFFDSQNFQIDPLVGQFNTEQQQFVTNDFMNQQSIETSQLTQINNVQQESNFSIDDAVQRYENGSKSQQDCQMYHAKEDLVTKVNQYLENGCKISEYHKDNLCTMKVPYTDLQFFASQFEYQKKMKRKKTEKKDGIIKPTKFIVKMTNQYCPAIADSCSINNDLVKAVEDFLENHSDTLTQICDEEIKREAMLNQVQNPKWTFFSGLAKTGLYHMISAKMGFSHVAQKEPFEILTEIAEKAAHRFNSNTNQGTTQFFKTYSKNVVEPSKPPESAATQSKTAKTSSIYSTTASIISEAPIPNVQEVSSGRKRKSLKNPSFD